MIDSMGGSTHQERLMAADTREAEREVARVVAALRMWHAAASAAAATTAGSS